MVKKNKFRMAGLAGLVACLAYSLPASAMPLQEAVAQAVRTHPDVLAAEEVRLSAEQGVKKAFAGYLPAVNFTAGYGREYSDNPTTRAGEGNHATQSLNRGETGIALNQMLFDGFDVAYTVAKARAESKAAKVGLEQSAYGFSADGAPGGIALKAVHAYLDTVIRNAQVDLIENYVRTTEEIHGKMRRSYEGGTGNKADVQLAESRVNLAKANRASTRTAYRNARATFLKFVGVAAGDLSRPPPPDSALPTSLEQALEHASKSNHTLAQARFILEAREADEKAARAPFMPKVDMELAAQDNANLAGSPGHSTSAMLRLKYNLFQGGRDYAEFESKRHLVKKARQDLDSRQRDVAEKVEAAWNDLAMSRDRVEYLKRHKELSKQFIDSAHDQLKMGKRTLLDVLNSEGELFTAKTSLLTEELTFIKTAYRLLAQMGVLDQVLGGGDTASASDDSDSEQKRSAALAAPADQETVQGQTVVVNEDKT